MNKRGQIDTFLLPVIALMFITISIYGMFTFDENISKEKAELRAIYGKSSAVHEHLEEDLKKIINDSIQLSRGSDSFENDLKESISDLADERRTSEQNTNLYAKLALEEYSLESNSNGYEIEIKDIFEYSLENNNELKYTYSLRIVFDKDKILSFMKESL